MTVDLVLKLYDDAFNREKCAFMSKLEVAFDDIRNKLPEEYFELIESISFGGSIQIKLTVE